MSTINNWRRLLLASRSPNCGEFNGDTTLSTDCCGGWVLLQLVVQPWRTNPARNILFLVTVGPHQPQYSMYSLRTRRIRHVLRICLMQPHLLLGAPLSQPPPQWGGTLGSSAGTVALMFGDDSCVHLSMMDCGVPDCGTRTTLLDTMRSTNVAALQLPNW